MVETANNDLTRENFKRTQRVLGALRGLKRKMEDKERKLWGTLTWELQGPAYEKLIWSKPSPSFSFPSFFVTA